MISYMLTNRSCYQVNTLCLLTFSLRILVSISSEWRTDTDNFSVDYVLSSVETTDFDFPPWRREQFSAYVTAFATNQVRIGNPTLHGRRRKISRLLAGSQERPSRAPHAIRDRRGGIDHRRTSHQPLIATTHWCRNPIWVPVACESRMRTTYVSIMRMCGFMRRFTAGRACVNYHLRNRP